MNSNTIYYFKFQTWNLALQPAYTIFKLTIQLILCSNTIPYKTLSNPIYQNTYLEHIIHILPLCIGVSAFVGNLMLFSFNCPSTSSTSSLIYWVEPKYHALTPFSIATFQSLTPRCILGGPMESCFR